jgi:hypothetical protein
MRLKAFLSLCLFALIAVTASAQGTTAVATEGGMYFGMNGSIAQALGAQGISLGTTGYNNDGSGSGYIGFPLAGGTLDLNNGNGITQFDGSLDFQSGDQLLQLKELSFVNVGQTPFISAAIWENGVFQYRQIIFLVISGNAFGPLSYGPIHTSNIYLSFNPMFVGALDDFFGTPDLATALAPNPNFGQTAFFGVSAAIEAAPALPTQDSTASAKPAASAK